MGLLSKFLGPVGVVVDALTPEKTGMSSDEAKWLEADKKSAAAGTLGVKPANTRAEFKATQEARKTFDDKNYSGKESVKITQGDIVDGDKMKVGAKDMKDLKVEDLQKIDDKAIKEVNMGKMGGAVTQDAVGTRGATKVDDAAGMLGKIKSLKKAPSFVLNIIKKNPKTAALAAGAAWLTKEIMDGEEQKDEPMPIDPLTGQVATNSEAANKQAEETINTTKQEIVESSKDIAEQVKSGEITKDEAREQIGVLKEFASYNFETSISDNLKMKGIDNSYENREKLAEILGIKDYEGTYEQNIQMLDKVRYMKKENLQKELGIS